MVHRRFSCLLLLAIHFNLIYYPFVISWSESVIKIKIYKDNKESIDTGIFGIAGHYFRRYIYPLQK